MRSSPDCPALPLTRSCATWSWTVVAACVGLIACVTACEKDFRSCEAGLCPSGTSCNTATGLCEAPTGPRPDPVGLFGRISLVQLSDGKLGVAGLAPAHQSLAFLSGQAAEWQTTFVAGPAAAAEAPSSGHVSAAVVGPDGVVHLAWARATDASLWYASGGPSGWHTEAVAAATAGTVGDEVAVGLWQGRPVVAWRAGAAPWVRVARRQADGNWAGENVPSPPPPVGDAPQEAELGSSLTMAILPSGPALAYHDDTHGDLVLAVNAPQGWSVSRIAGSDPTTGADTGDVGRPVATAVGQQGGLAVAYLDRTRGQVWVARSSAGLLTHQVVADGGFDDPSSGARRVALLGTALSVVVLPSDRVAVAMLDASRLRLRVAVEKVSGGFVLYDVPGTRPQLWPSLLVPTAGGLKLGYVELDAPRGPAASAVSVWSVPVGGTP